VACCLDRPHPWETAGSAEQRAGDQACVPTAPSHARLRRGRGKQHRAGAHWEPRGCDCMCGGVPVSKGHIHTRTSTLTVRGVSRTPTVDPGRPGRRDIAVSPREDKGPGSPSPPPSPSQVTTEVCLARGGSLSISDARLGHVGRGALKETHAGLCATGALNRIAMPGGADWWHWTGLLTAGAGWGLLTDRLPHGPRRGRATPRGLCRHHHHPQTHTLPVPRQRPGLGCGPGCGPVSLAAVSLDRETNNTALGGA
jgi:hypothetical protein